MGEPALAGLVAVLILTGDQYGQMMLPTPNGGKELIFFHLRCYSLYVRYIYTQTHKALL